jgi:hypothetical protein
VLKFEMNRRFPNHDVNSHSMKGVLFKSFLICETGRRFLHHVPTSSILACGWNGLLLFCWAELSSLWFIASFLNKFKRRLCRRFISRASCVSIRQRWLFVSHGTARLLLALGFFYPFFPFCSSTSTLCACLFRHDPFFFLPFHFS